MRGDLLEYIPRSTVYGLINSTYKPVLSSIYEEYNTFTNIITPVCDIEITNI